HGLGGRMTGLLGPRFDPELVHLDAPRGGRAPGAEHAVAEAENRPEARAVADLGHHGREPALDAAEERVVFLPLIVRLMRLPGDGAVARHLEDRVAAAAIASAVGEIGIFFERVPARRERRPGSERADALERAPHVRANHERIAGVPEGIAYGVRIHEALAHAYLLLPCTGAKQVQVADGLTR